MDERHRCEMPLRCLHSLLRSCVWAQTFSPGLCLGYAAGMPMPGHVPHCSWPLLGVLVGPRICLVPLDMCVIWAVADLHYRQWTCSAGEGTAWPTSLSSGAPGCQLPCACWAACSCCSWQQTFLLVLSGYPRAKYMISSVPVYRDKANITDSCSLWNDVHHTS